MALADERQKQGRGPICLSVVGEESREQGGVGESKEAVQFLSSTYCLLDSARINFYSRQRGTRSTRCDLRWHWSRSRAEPTCPLGDPRP